MRNSSSKSVSGEQSLSLSSLDTSGPTVEQHVSAEFDRQTVLLEGNNGFTYKTEPTGQTAVRKPLYLELRQTHSPAKTGSGSGSNNAPTMSTFRRGEPHPYQEQHPRANTRIYHQPMMTTEKPRLRREYSVAYEPSMGLPHQTSVPEMLPAGGYEAPPDLVQEHRRSSNNRAYGSNYIDLM